MEIDEKNKSEVWTDGRWIEFTGKWVHSQSIHLTRDVAICYSTDNRGAVHCKFSSSGKAAGEENRGVTEHCGTEEEDIRLARLCVEELQAQVHALRMRVRETM